MSVSRSQTNCSEQLYRWLLGFYPRQFRSEFDLQMMHAFRDHKRALLKKRGRSGLIVLWWQTLLDFVTTMPTEYLKRSEMMSTLEKDLRWDIGYGFQMLFRHSIVAIRIAGYAFAVSIGLAALLLVACLIWTWHKQPQVDQVWREALGRTPDETYQSLTALFPKQDANDAATKLQALTTKLGIVSRAMPGTQQSEQPSGIFRTWDVPPYLYAQLSSGSDGIAEPPEEIRRYLDAHAEELTQLYTLIKQNDVPRWEMDLTQLLEAPVPSFFYHRQLHGVIALDILEKTRAGKYQQAVEAFEASWKINQSLNERPELITRVMASSILGTQLALLRKMSEVPPLWQQRLAGMNIRDPRLQSLELDNVILAQYLTRSRAKGDRFSWVDSLLFSGPGWPIRRLWSQELLEKTAWVVAQMKSVSDWCSFNPESFRELMDMPLSRWNPVRLNHTSLFKGVAQEIASLELTVEVLKVKAAQSKNKVPSRLAPSRSLLCPEASWIHEATAHGIVIRCNRFPEWMSEMRDLNGHPFSPTYALK